MKSRLAKAALLGALISAALGAPAGATEVGPYFPAPMSYNLSGSPKDALLKAQAAWLESGVNNMKKAKAEAEAALEKAKAASKGDEAKALEEKIAKLDADIARVTKEIELAQDTTASQEVQMERKRLFLLSVNSWINELNRLATEQMKIAILKDGAEAQAAQSRNYQLSEQSDALVNAVHDVTIEQWAIKR